MNEAEALLTGHEHHAPSELAPFGGWVTAFETNGGVTVYMRCWVHRLAKVLDKLPKRLQPKAEDERRPIMNAADRTGIRRFEARYGPK
jgi:hypothetical protein